METITYTVRYMPHYSMFTVFETRDGDRGELLELQDADSPSSAVNLLRREIRRLEAYEFAAIELESNVVDCPHHEAIERFAREVNAMHESLAGV